MDRVRQVARRVLLFGERLDELLVEVARDEARLELLELLGELRVLLAPGREVALPGRPAGDEKCPFCQYFTPTAEAAS